MNSLACGTNGVLLFAAEASKEGGGGDIVKYFQDYSPPVAILIVVVLAIIYVLRTTVDKRIAQAFDEKAKAFEILFKRRSDFEDRVLTTRFTLVTELTSRLERVATNLNRLSSGVEPDPEFMKGNEVVPLTALFEEIQIHRLVLTEDLYKLLNRRAQIALELANAGDPEIRRRIMLEWESNREKIRALVRNMFQLDSIKATPD